MRRSRRRSPNVDIGCISPGRSGRSRESSPFALPARIARQAAVCLHRAFRTIACAGSTGREAFEAGFRPLKAELAFASAVTEAWQSKARLTESGTLSKRSACACSLPNLRKACARGRWRRRPDRAADVIWFVTDLRSGKEHEIEVEHDVGLVFVDANENAYLSITARAEVRRDRAKTAEIWKKTDDMWWDGPD